MTSYKLGKLPARPGAVSLQFRDYVAATRLPKIPSKVGHVNLLPTDMEILGNDRYGDCVWAGAAHETMAWNLHASHALPVFTEQSVLSDYSAVTGFNPANGTNDNGTNMKDAASYRRKIGVLDGHGVRHKVDAYLALTPGDLNELRTAIYLFGAVGVGVNFPGYWMDQFNQGKPWTYRKNAKFEGGHYIPVFGSASPKGALTLATWGKLTKMSAASYQHFSDEAIAYVSVEALNAQGKSLEGFDINQLRADLAAVTSV